MAEIADLQSLLLDLISPRPVIDPARISALNRLDWDRLSGMARQHRVGPMLHWQLSRGRAGLRIPADIRQELAAGFKRSTLNALALRRELILIHRLLKAAGIPYLALKGAFLAFHAYPGPGLRPLRDLDILVPEGEALRAFETLIAGGLVRPAAYQGNPEAVISIHKHLPPLRTASGRVTVEVHARLHNPVRGAANWTDPSAAPAFWHRAIEVQADGEALRFPAPTDQLLHLIIHAVQEHKFTNGPLILSDIAFLLERQPIDWDGFWQGAARAHLLRTCWLTLSLVEVYWGGANIRWPEASLSYPGAERAREQAALLMLRDFGIRDDVRLARDLGQVKASRDLLGFLLDRLFPPKARIAALYPVHQDSPLLYLYYLPHLWRLASQRLPDFLQSRRHPHIQAEIDLLGELEQWLSHP